MGKKKKNGKPISAKRIQNVVIPLRVIVKDAIEEFCWSDFPDPFSNCKLPRPKKYRVQPLSFDEWTIVINFIPDWYKPYLEFAVQTGLRPSEQVALKWIARTLGHVDTSMVYKTYGRYIPNLTKMDGSAIERRFAESENKKGDQLGHNCGHNRDLAAAFFDPKT